MINSRDIKDLHPVLKRGSEELKRLMEIDGYDMLVTCTYRDNEYQDSLYAQGRTTSGNIVTNAKGGQSMHNYKLAFDICKNVKGHEFDDSKFFTTAGNHWTKMGGEWGGIWKSPDKPHFQFTDGAKDSDIFNGTKKVGNDVKMAWELEVVEEEVKYNIIKINVIKNGKNISTNAINKDNKNYVELDDYEKSYGNVVDYNDTTKLINVHTLENKNWINEQPTTFDKSDGRLTLIKYSKTITTGNIFYKDKNYVELRDYEESFGNIVTYDDKTKQIVVKE